MNDFLIRFKMAVQRRIIANMLTQQKKIFFCKNGSYMLVIQNYTVLEIFAKKKIFLLSQHICNNFLLDGLLDLIEKLPNNIHSKLA